MTTHAGILKAAIFLCAVSVASPASFTTTPTMDAFVTTGESGNLVNNNYGGGGSLTLAAAGLEMGEAQTVMQFNLAGAVSLFDAQFGAGVWTIDSVTLRITAANANNAIFNSPAPGAFGISWMQNDSWQEGAGSPASPGATGITFNNLPTFMSPSDESLGEFQLSGATSGSTTYTLGLTPGLLSDVESGSTLSLRLFAADDTVSGVFNSRNFGTIGNRPVLTVVAVPEPGTLALLGLGLLAGLVCRLRR